MELQDNARYLSFVWFPLRFLGSPLPSCVIIPPLYRRSTAIVDIASLLKASDSNESLLPSSQQSRSTSVPASTGPAVTTASSYGPPLYAAPPRLGGVAPMVAGTVGKRGVPPHLSEAPAKKQSKWSAEEDALIIDLRGSGMKWEDISKRLPGRSAISCRLHYQNYLERRSEWDEERKNKLARLYERFKPEMWAKVAEEMAIPWRAAEAMHWQLGEQDMARRAGVTPFSLSAQTLETAHGSSRSSRHAHSTSQGGIPREVSHGRGYGGRGAAMPPARPLASRRESLPTHHLPPPPEHYEVPYGYPHTHGGGHLAPIHTQHPPPRPGMLPSVAELTTGRHGEPRSLHATARLSATRSSLRRFEKAKEPRGSSLRNEQTQTFRTTAGSIRPLTSQAIAFLETGQNGIIVKIGEHTGDEEELDYGKDKNDLGLEGVHEAGSSRSEAVPYALHTLPSFLALQIPTTSSHIITLRRYTRGHHTLRRFL
ncbi:hypothetical protein F4680DRAFT_465346 [Xylaria scruposa]|nr:hypothetical protein F4680DRAFT_465346 [Xylaria scruposa]